MLQSVAGISAPSAPRGVGTVGGEGGGEPNEEERINTSREGRAMEDSGCISVETIVQCLVIPSAEIPSA